MKIIYKDGHVDECPQDQELHVIRHSRNINRCNDRLTSLYCISRKSQSLKIYIFLGRQDA